MDSSILAFKEGGFMMYMILLAGMMALGITIERAIVLWGGFPRGLRRYVEKIFKEVDADNLNGAIGLCEKDKNSLTSIIGAALKFTGDNDRGMQNAVDEAALTEIPRLQDRTAYLAVIAQISTLLGLLGTIIGLMQSFEAVGSADASQKAALLASGISKALNTTAFGLFIAVPSMLSYTILQRRTEKIIDLLDEYSVTLMNKLAKKRAKASSPESIVQKSADEVSVKS